MKKFRIFLNPIESREKWLNRMGDKGYKLNSISGMGTVYEFVETDCKYEYKAQYIGYMSNDERLEYESFLKDANYDFWNLQINLGQVSIGRVKFRPYARGTGKLATSAGMINREILIVEKLATDGEFRLFTDVESSIADLKMRRRTYIYLLSMITFFAAFGMFFNNQKPIFKWTWKSYEGISSPIAISIIILLAAIYSLYFIVMLSFEIKNLKESPYQ